MRKGLDYDKAYESALNTNNPIEFIDNRWDNPLPYYNGFINTLKEILN